MKKLVVTLATIMWTSSLMAVDFSEADALFDRRDEGRAVIAQARAAYEALLPSAGIEEQVKIGNRLGWLAIFEGNVKIPKSQNAERKEVFSRCWREFAEILHPDKIGRKTAYYYYWKGACLSYWGQTATTIERAMNVHRLKKVFNEGFEWDTRYRGGGLHRVKSGINQNKLTKPVGLYDPEQALVEAEAALASEPGPGEVHGGLEFYSNYRFKVDALIELNRLQEAHDLATEIVEEIEFLIEENQLPQGLEPETRFEMRNLIERRDNLSRSL